MQAFWPFWTALFFALGPLLFGWHDSMSIEVFWGYAVVAVLGIVGTAMWGLWRFRAPTRDEAVQRVDATMPGRPIAAIKDEQIIGATDPASQAVWRAHMARMAARTREARAVDPDLRVSARDPYGLRYMALLFFVVALLFGSVLRVGSVGQIVSGGPQTLATGPMWEGWITPPAYTGRPTLYLNDLPAGPLRVPAGSEIALRMYGAPGALQIAQSVADVPAVPEGTPPQMEQTFVVARSGRLEITGEGGILWEITAIADTSPTIRLDGPIEADAMGELSQPFVAQDDYGVTAGTATITLDLAEVDRRHGLATSPDPRDALVLDLPLPFNGARDDIAETLIENLSEHPFANLPVALTLRATDAAGQTGESAPESLVLPGRRFFQPVARAVIEQRRDLLWSKQNGQRVEQVLRAISHRPEGLFSNETTYLRMRLIIRRLDSFNQFGLSDDSQAEIAQAMWDLAIQLEDGRLADARERLRRAQERLEEAMRNGASDSEIAELMQELREATDDYLRMLAEQAEPGEDGTDQPDMAENSQSISQDEIQALMDRIQELMEEGRMAEAQALMEQLNALLENLQVTQGEGGQGGGPPSPGQQAMEDLADTLRDQEELSDEAFNDLQEQTNPGQQGQQGQQNQPGQQGQEGQPGQQGQQGQQGQGQGVGDETQDGQTGGNGAGEDEGAPDGRSLAERQQALRDELARQRGNLPNLDGEAGDTARQSLDRAEGAMEGAEEALRDGDLAEAIDQQAEAMDALRNGMRALGEALAQNENTQPGQGADGGQANGRVEPTRRDPLGRQLGNNGQFGTDQNLLQGEDVYRRAEELLDELRRRSAEQERPEVEKDYLKRLLDRF